jgi:hypothetical protein
MGQRIRNHEGEVMALYNTEIPVSVWGKVAEEGNVSTFVITGGTTSITLQSDGDDSLIMLTVPGSNKAPLGDDWSVVSLSPVEARRLGAALIKHADA